MTQAHPFIKWAGGKRQLLPELLRRLPQDFANRPVYVEPFIGGGALFLLLLQKFPHIKHAVIGDVNKELIGTYQTIKSRVGELLVILAQLQESYLPLDAKGRLDLFLRQRMLFNADRTDPLMTAARFIFLNKTCFNGLYRVNSKGLFNVPHGNYKRPHIMNNENLRALSELLRRVDIVCGDFELALHYAGDLSKTFWYLDPPYKPLTPTASFTSYAAGGFDDAEQERLAAFCRKLDAGGAKFLLSNSDPQGNEAGFFDRLYEGFKIDRVQATRAINSDPRGRGATSEIIVSN